MSDVYREIESLPESAPGRVVAYFDLDRTLIAGYTITALALEKVWSGSLSPGRILAHASIFLGWGLGRSDYHDLLEAIVKRLAGVYRHFRQFFRFGRYKPAWPRR